MKNIILFIFILLTNIGFSQKNVLEVNKNYTTTELVSFLNVEGDTLKLRSEHTIGRVEIFNMDMPFNYERYPWSKEVDVSLKDIPNGRFILGVSTNKKLIIQILQINSNKKKKNCGKN
ncbi:MAG: hypothetical protein ACK5G7_01230 [Erysipelotrichaceae bacterium]